MARITPSLFLLLTTDRVAAFSEDDILLAGLAATSRTPNGFRLISIDGMLADPYALMLRRDDQQFKATVDPALREVFASGDIQRIYAVARQRDALTRLRRLSSRVDAGPSGFSGWIRAPMSVYREHPTPCGLTRQHLRGVDKSGSHHRHLVGSPSHCLA